ncbi:hypothetical protein AB0K23_14130 [Streptomyces sp. NPDC049602]|uniref:hypothetical protein n=1 Tax=Streptomyces sp. NPDC049602 TaxID=3155504 RepID=UPI003413F531
MRNALVPRLGHAMSSTARNGSPASALPAGPSRALVRLTTRSARLYDSVTVDDYPAPPVR